MVKNDDYSIVSNLDLRLLVGLVKTLPRFQKDIVTMHFWDGLGIFEISQRSKRSYTIVEEEFQLALSELRKLCMFYGISPKRRWRKCA